MSITSMHTALNATSKPLFVPGVTSLFDLLEEIRARDEAIESLVIAHFKLEAERDRLVETVRRLTVKHIKEHNEQG